jgi:hypothetical protein
MNKLRVFLPAALAALLALGGCATAPTNLPITHADPAVGYRFQTRHLYARSKEDLVVLAFSGGGTRAAAFSYGVLEALRDTEVIVDGHRERPLTRYDRRLVSHRLPTVCAATGCSANTSSVSARCSRRDAGRAESCLPGLLLPYWGRSEPLPPISMTKSCSTGATADLARPCHDCRLQIDLSSGARFSFHAEDVRHPARFEHCGWASGGGAVSGVPVVPVTGDDRSYAEPAAESRRSSRAPRNGCRRAPGRPPQT